MSLSRNLGLYLWRLLGLVRLALSPQAFGSLPVPLLRLASEKKSAQAWIGSVALDVCLDGGFDLASPNMTSLADP